MAAWTLPHRITDWCENLTTALDRRSRKYFISVVLGMVLATGRRTVSSWLRAAGVSAEDREALLQQTCAQPHAVEMPDV